VFDTKGGQTPEVEPLTFDVGDGIGKVSAWLTRPACARWLLVMGHGAGADMNHPFMVTLARKLADECVATLRYNFPYTEQGRKRPDHARRLIATVRAAVSTAASVSPGLPLIAGGKSMGGRMTSLAAAQAPLPGVRGLAFFGFPLHAPGKPSTDRANHLDGIDLPMLFAQGTRDRLAGLPDIESVLAGLGGRATLYVVEGGDHSFKVLKRLGKTEDEIHASLAEAVGRWGERHLG